MHIAPPFAHFPFAEDNITTSIAENSIATSGGVKISQSRMSFALQSTGNSCFNFERGCWDASHSRVAGSAPTGLVYDGLDKAAMIEASGVP